MKFLKQIIFLLLIQLLVFSQTALCADLLRRDGLSTLSPEISLNDNFLQRAFLAVPAERDLDEEIEERRDVDLREKYERILHWTREGDFLDNVLRIANSEKPVKVQRKTVQGIISRLYSHLPLGKIVSKGNMGDRFVVFEVPGISREGFGIKDLNDIFGYELNTQLIQARSKILYRKMLEKGLIQGEEGHVYSTGTISCWLKMDSSSVSEQVYDGSSNDSTNISTQSGINIQVNQNTFYIRLQKNDVGSFINGGTFSTGTWRHVVYTWNGTARQLLINNVSIATATHQNHGQFTSTLFFGKRIDNLYPGDFTIDETAMWNRVLTPTEVTTLYNSGTGLFY